MTRNRPATTGANATARSRTRMHVARSCLACGLAAAILAAMATLAIASTARDGGSAIPATALAPMLHGTATAGSGGAPPQVAIPRSLVGRQLAWLLAETNDGSATLTQSELRAHAGGRFLAVVPAREIIEFLRRASDEHGQIRLTGFAGRPSAVSATALISTQTHHRFRVHLAVDGRSHHLITSLSIDESKRSDGR